MVCPKNAALIGELGRAKRRAELEAKAEKARGELDLIYTPRQANADTHALASYLTAFGMPVSGDTLNKALILLAVLTIEMGGGLALTIAMSLGQERQQTRPMDRATDHPERSGSEQPNKHLNATSAYDAGNAGRSDATSIARTRELKLPKDAQADATAVAMV